MSLEKLAEKNGFLANRIRQVIHYGSEKTCKIAAYFTLGFMIVATSL